jgi:hypothetical protein
MSYLLADPEITEEAPQGPAEVSIWRWGLLKGFLPSGPGADLCLWLWQFLIRHAQRTGDVLGRGGRDLELARSCLVS